MESESLTYRLTMLRNRVHVCLQLLLFMVSYLLFGSAKDVYIIWFQWGKNVPFAYSMTVILYRLWFSMVTVIFWWILSLRLNDFNCTWLVRNIWCLYSVLFLFWTIVLKVVKLQVIWSCSEQNILFWLTKCLYFSRFVKTDWQFIHKFTE